MGLRITGGVACAIVACAITAATGAAAPRTESGARAVYSGAWAPKASMPTAAGPAWSEPTIPGPPSPARNQFAHVYDPIHDVLTIFGGFGTCAGGHLSDVWTLTGAASTTSPTWVNRTPATGNPAGRWASRAVYDPVSNRMTIFGGNLGCSSPATNEVLLLANANGVGASPAWIPVAPAGPAPAPRSVHSAVYDPVSNSMIIQGGGDAFTAASYGDTWALRNANGRDSSGNPATPTWVQIATSPAMQFHDYATAVYNPLANTMIVYGGRVCSDPPTIGNCLSGIQTTNKVWTLSNANGLGPGTPTWTELTPTGTPPSAEAGQVATYDVANDRMIVFGGQTINGVFLSDTWVLSGATGPTPQWQQLTPDPPLPPGRAFGGGGYNPALNRLLIFGGASTTGVLSDTWVLSDANGITPPPPPPPNVVINTSDSGPGSLRAAIEFANSTPGPNTISFAIPPTDLGFNGHWFSIRPATPLPPLTDAGTTIDGATQTAFGGDTNPAGPEIELNGANAGPADGLVLSSSGDTVNALAVNGFLAGPPNTGRGGGIQLNGAGNVVTGSYIGVDPTGTTAVPNQINGIGVGNNAGQGNRIGGTTPADRNVISGNGLIGVLVTAGDDNTLIEGNYIGTNAAGAAALGNGPAQSQNAGEAGIHLQSNQNTISGNVISGNTVGVGIFNTTSTGNAIRANYIGTDASGTSAIPNVQGGLVIGSNGNTVGGASAADRNVISGNGSDGVNLSGPSNRIQGNYIGTNAAGTGALPNAQDGVNIINFGGSADGNVIVGNVVSGNAHGGVHVTNFLDASQTIRGTVIQGNLIGTNAAGDGTIANGQDGIRLDGASNSVVGGTDPGARNVISGNQQNGVSIGGAANDNRIQGNYIGTDATGSSAVGNNWGVAVQGFGSAVTGTVVVGNTVSGNHTYGVFVGQNAPGTMIQGNRIGTNAAGTAAVGNGLDTSDCCGGGVRVNDGGADVTIGGPAAADRNVISGNHVGVGVIGATRVLIQGNYIGTDATGTSAIPNAQTGEAGIRFFTRVTNSTIRGNVISGNGTSGNGGPGISFTSGPGESTSNNVVEGNLVGTNASGTAAVPNHGAAIVLAGDGVSQNTIGGATASSRNVVSGNEFSAIRLANGAWGNTVQGNYLGLAADGATRLGNGGSGVIVVNAGNDDPSKGNVLTDNVVSANGSPNNPDIQAAGILMLGNSRGNSVQGNRIGTDAAGNPGLGNDFAGVLFMDGAHDNVVGGTAAGAANVIASNLGAGVALFACDPTNPPLRDRITRNSIFGNVAGRSDFCGPGGPALIGLGIDLGGDGVTLNNCCGHVGPNDFQNFPVLKNANSDPANNQIIVTGSIDTPNPTTVAIELFANAVPTPGADPSGYGEGATFLGTVTPKANGKFTAKLPLVPVGTIISSTATDASGNTSEFSADVAVK